MKTNFFFPLIVLILGTILAGIVLYYFTRSAADVRYTLNDPVPVSFLNPTGSGESIQQLEVRNIGSAKAERIQVKIRGQIDKYQLDQHSQDDKPTIFNQNGQFELVYPELPPQGGFKLVFRALNTEINAGNLQISDNAGPVQSALTSGGSSWWTTGLWFALLLIPAAIYVFGTFSYFAETSLMYEPVSKILRASKPFYVRSAKWKRAVVGALKYRIGRDYRTTNLPATDTYTLLNSEKPPDIDLSDWNTLVSDANKKFEDMYGGNLAIASSDKILDVLRLTKPANLERSAWEGLRTKAEDAYVESRTRFVWQVEKIIANLKQEKPEVLSDEKWFQLLKELRTMLYEQLRSDLYLKKNPIKYLESLDLAALDQEYTVKLFREALDQQYGYLGAITTVEDAQSFLGIDRPEWMIADNFLRLKRQAERIIEMEKLKTEYQQKLIEVSSQNLEAAAGKERQSQQLAEKTAEVEADQAEIRELQKKVQNQLDLIDKALNDPDALDRIEEYSVSFAPGNFKNLKMLADRSRDGDKKKQ